MKRHEFVKISGELTKANNDLQILNTQLKYAKETLKRYQNFKNPNNDQNMNESNIIRYRSFIFEAKKLVAKPCYGKKVL